LTYRFELRFEGGKRCYDEIYTGDWFKNVQEILDNENPGQNVAILSIILSSDSTTLSKNALVHNVYLSLGNMEQSQRQKPGSREVMNFLFFSFLKKRENKSEINFYFTFQLLLAGRTTSSA